ncbi:MBL fold metallo-hydrolase [Paenibacillus sp. F411]|uniref:MBL fold metallo-hydrolase n=1 Tax=Paenibacillus sp. F411 TaxID=2820239 RepID=UPI001AAF8D18|nr:MBL fold metallo-hydrolase [Paenibacillus sp. F411]MBO2944549.1 MBL fold metallo-hydrolase [Paenibacillus sp. F411]
MIYIWIVLAAVILGAVLFMSLHPVFGGSPTRGQVARYSEMKNYTGNRFRNLETTRMSMNVSDLLSMTRDSMIGRKERTPKAALPMVKTDWSRIDRAEDHVTWFGHSAFLLQMDSKHILVDPMLGMMASPVSFAGSKRYSQDVLQMIHELPPIDAVLITHDHYDHLDYPSISKLRHKVRHFFVPCGVSAHLIRWGVPEDAITELNWWEEREFEGLRLVLTPSKHFSGRGLLNKDTTLWGGWVILGQRTRVFTSGDGGYGAHFKKIGETYGPFDLALVEGGQYDHRWSWVHMTPEEAVQAARDVQGAQMMLIHWGAFTLAYHGWTEPIERALPAAEQLNMKLVTPRLGETIPLIQQDRGEASGWWRDVVEKP